MLATSTKWKLSLGDRCFILLVDTVRHVLYCKGLLIAGLMKEFVRELQGDVQKFKVPYILYGSLLYVSYSSSVYLRW